MQNVYDKKVMDLIVPLNDYDTISHSSTIFEAITLFEQSKMRKDDGERRIVNPLLVVDDNNRVIGKIGPLCCLKAISPGFCVDSDDIGKIKNLDEFHTEFLETLLCKKMIEQCLSEEKLAELSKTKVINVMYAISDTIDADCSIFVAIQKLVDSNALSMLVTQKSAVIGIIHLFDLYNELTSNS